MNSSEQNPSEQSAHEATMRDRRESVRSRVACPARITVGDAARPGVLRDISEHGARLQLENPPAIGSRVVLEWEDQEAHCKIVWASEARCGLKFDIPIERSVVDACPRTTLEGGEKIAALGQIQMGQKRQRRFGGDFSDAA